MELDKQLARLKCQMISRGYSEAGLKIYTHCWIHLIEVAIKTNHEEFCEELAEAFIVDIKRKSRNYPKNEKKYFRCLELIRYFL